MTTIFQMFLETSLRMCIAATAVKLVLMISRIRSGSVSHAAWTAVLFAMLLMPVLPAVMPKIQVPIPEATYSSTVLHIAGGNGSPSVSPDIAPRTSMSSIASSATSQPMDDGYGFFPRIVFITYFMIAFLLFGRLTVGWLGTIRIACTSIPETDVGDSNIFESSMVAVPMTVGLISSRIILPLTWKTWPLEKLHAVISHEKSHVRRRDPLVMFAARINCCIFWFHPVAWWLKHNLALTSEMACDEAAVAQIQDGRGYARFLIELSEEVRRHGSRFSWDGVGIHGNGLLSRRIDLILSDSKKRTVSTARKSVLTVCCAAAIVVAVACHRAPAPLREDLQYSAQQTTLKERGEFVYNAGHMTADEVAALEKTLDKNPEDLVARRKLLVFYDPDFTGNVVARRRHVLWFIQHHPDDEVLSSLDARIFPANADLESDPAGYAEAKRLWLQQTAQYGTNTKVLANAASFFEIIDKPIAEELLSRANGLNPNGQWARRLGLIYAHEIVGSVGSTPSGAVRSVSLAEAHSSYAGEVRKKLSESTNDRILSAAGQSLTLYLDQVKGLDFDPRPLGVSYLERALQLNPQSTEAHFTLVSLRRGARMQRQSEEIFRNVAEDSQYQVIASLPEAERFDYLPWLVQWSFMIAQDADYHEKPAAAKSAWNSTERYAQDLLSLAGRLQQHPNYGTAIYIGNLGLSSVALHEGNQRKAVRYLHDAANAPDSEEFAYSTDGVTQRLIGQLLKNGERESVIEFLQKIARIKVLERNQLLQAAAAIRDGRMPIWYQALVH